MKADLTIIDGRHLLFRTSDAFRDLEAIGADGEPFPTGGIFGFLNVATKIWSRYGGTVVVAWEGDRRNFRLDLYPEYKRKNEPMDPDKAEFVSEMAVQESCLKRFLQCMGVRQYLGVNCEADDVIGRLSKTVAANGKRVLIYSGDSDLRSLIQDADPAGLSTGSGGVWTASPGMKGNGDKIYDREAVVERHGVPPEQLAELKALAGDKSDNVPGVMGIGDKTAAKLINHYGDLLSVSRAAIEEDEGWPVAKRHMAGIADCHLLHVFHKLTTIDTDCAMDTITPEKRQKDVVELIKSYKFRTLSGPVELHSLMRMGG